MLNVNKLKGAIVENGLTQKELAKKIGISPKTFGMRLKTGKFYNDEISIMIRELNIQDPTSIFFAS